MMLRGSEALPFADLRSPFLSCLLSTCILSSFVSIFHHSCFLDLNVLNDFNAFKDVTG
jgi:hypothetical protein